MTTEGFMRLLSAAALIVALCAFSASAAEPVSLDTLKTHLEQNHIATTNVGTDALEFKTGFPDGKNYSFVLKADAKSKFIYLAVVNLAALKSDDKDFCAKSKKLMTLNYGIALSKLEWDEQTGEVRLSNAFASERGLSKSELFWTIQMLLTTAEKLGPDFLETKK
jgi:hypothetical protein